MKKKILLLAVGIISGLLFGSSEVKANTDDSNLVTNYTGIWGYHYMNGTLATYGGLPFRYMNGRLSYCIDPTTPITVHTYSSYTDWSKSGYSDDTRKQMELIAYYGYQYPGHNDLKYYMAVQELIWNFSGDVVVWKENKNINSNTLNVDNEKNEIMSLVNNHNKMPSFINTSHNYNFGETISMVDENNVLSNYDISSDVNYTVNGNVLTFTLNKFGSNNIYFSQKNMGNTSGTTVFIADRYKSQKMASFGLPTFNSGNININVDNVKVEFTKKDIETKEIITGKSAKYKLVNVDTKEEVIVDIDSSGIKNINLKNGKYIVEEVNAPYGYTKNKEKINIVIDNNITLTDDKLKIDLFDKIVKGKIKIIKKDEEDNDLSGVTLGIYDSKYNLIEKIVTNEDNNVSKVLPLGKYYVKELNALYGYKLDDYYYEVNLDYKNQNEEIVINDLKIVNKKIKCNLVYITADKDGNPLSNVEINVLDKDGNIVFSGKTNDKGEVTIENLTYGEYKVVQTKVPSGYILNTEEVKFDVNDITCNSNITVTNEKTIMPVTSKQSSSYLAGFIILLGFGVYNFVKKDS